MEIFESILIMLSAVLFSNVLSRFIPNIAIPLIQIGLGMLLAVPMANHGVELSPELFMLLFLAPLLFNDGANVDKKALWKEKKPVLVLSIGLVFLTVGGLGYFINWLLPAVPLAASFALAAALAPTDAVAVSALAEKVKIPHRMMHTLEGESLINDASGLVSFQFAVAALLTGSFSLVRAEVSFVLISLGGVLLGIVISLLEIRLVNWLRSLGVENTVSFILMELLLPFIIFVVAESLEVNGILAVVSGGMVHSFSYRKMNPEVAQLQLLSKNTWSILTFSLNGLVFVLLGTQLPQIMHGVWKNNNVHNGMLIIYILSLSVILLGIRFLCFLIFKNFEKGSDKTKKEKLKYSALYTISGVRGTITLVSALSLPLLLNNGETFVERDLLISLAAGVILVTLLLANFTMPLFAEKNEVLPEETSHETEIEILREVTKQLKSQETTENQRQLSSVIRMYNGRILSLIESQEIDSSENELQKMALKWQLENAIHLLRDGSIDMQVGFPYLKRVNQRLYITTGEKQYQRNLFYGRMFSSRFKLRRLMPLSFEERQKQRILLHTNNNHYVVEKLKELPEGQYPQEVVDSLVSAYGRREVKKESTSEVTFEEWLDYAFQIERESLQKAFERGELTRPELKVLRDRLLAIESSVQFIQ